MRFFNFSPVIEDIVYGLWMGNDLNGDPICGIRIISKMRLDAKKVRQLIQEKIVTYEKEGIMNICKYTDSNTHKAACSCKLSDQMNGLKVACSFFERNPDEELVGLALDDGYLNPN
jgi:hypothetical protein